MCLAFRSIADREVTVRKNHRCGWCSERINKGEKARARTYVFDGDLTSDHMHPECYDGMSQSANEYLCDGWMPGDFGRGEIAA